MTCLGQSTFDRAAISPYLGLAVATVAVSFSAIFISEATAPPLVMATYRMALTAAILVPLALHRGRSRRLSSATGQATVARTA